jgi:REP element-mobilizing transposase RayT
MPFDEKRLWRTRKNSLRLPGYDYGSTGAYFVTSCTYERRPLFVKPFLCQFLGQEWLALEQRFPGIMLDEFVVMKDHIHGLIFIDAEVPDSPVLGDIMKAYKSMVKKRWRDHLEAINQPSQDAIWQRNYYDSIIRDQPHLDYVRLYIINNPYEALEEQIEEYKKRKGL